MSFRRALVDCAVLSLQDTCVFYPCCKCCFSKIDVEPQDTTRCRCSRCGSRCLREHVDYRYRLSLKVARDTCIFGVTVFGNSLNQFFGIHASGLQRLVENSDGPVGPSTKLTLLGKAVEDCFIGRHFIFGIKIYEPKSEPWLGGHVPTSSNSKDAVQFVATQIILPKAVGLEGCTVVSYYRILLQKASEYEPGDPSQARPPATTLLLVPGHSPTSSFHDVTLSTSGLLSHSLQRPDCTLTPTPPWQQSLGVVTSSAEQEEGCSTQDSGDESIKRTEKKTAPHPAQRDCLGSHPVTEERTPALPLQHSFSSSPSFSKHPNSSLQKCVVNSLNLSTWSSPSQPDHRGASCKEGEFSIRQLTKTFLSDSLAWDDLPFSESLTEYLCEGNKSLDSVHETKPSLNVHHQKETARKNPEITTSAQRRNTEKTSTHSQILLDVTNTAAPNGADRHDVSNHVCNNAAESVNRSRARISHECNQEDEEACSLEEEEQLERETYNCSADLFSSSLMISMNTHAETVRMSTGAGPFFSKPDKQHLRNEDADVTQSTPDKQKRKSSNYRDSLIPLDFDFVPPSQSTPIVKVDGASRSSASLYRNLASNLSSQLDNQDSGAFNGNPCEKDSKKTDKSSSGLCKSRTRLVQGDRESTKENSMWSATPSRLGDRRTPERRFRKQDKHKNDLKAQQHLGVQRETLNQGTAGIIHHKCVSRVCNETMFDCEDSEVVVPPTPAGKTQPRVMLRRRRRTDKSSSHLGSTCEEQHGDRGNCKRALLGQTLASSHRSLGQTGNCETADEGSLDGPNGYVFDDDNQTCDWSRDLFSDSV